jgi:hypothetical protein
VVGGVIVRPDGGPATPASLWLRFTLRNLAR